MAQKQVVIIGGGFAGVNLAKKIGNHENYHTILVDRNNYNFFPPLLYQVSTGFLEASNISYPFRRLIRNKPYVSFRLGELLKIDPALNKIYLSTGELSYDFLVLATGTETNYFGIENVKKYALPMKTVNDALEMRNNVLQRLEKATRVEDAEERKKLMTVVVAGGGPTGVEIAGMLADMRRNIFGKDYPELRGKESHIYLVDAGDKVLSPMSTQAQDYTYDSLIKMGVEVKLHKQVKDFENDLVTFADGEQIPAKTLIWAAGVTSSVFEGLPKEVFGRGRRLMVDAYNKVQGYDNIYALGDTCIQTTDPAFPGGHPQLAQVAIQQAKNFGQNLINDINGKERKPFLYHDKGSMAIIGRNKAVADLPKPKLHFKGFIAFFMWIFIHVVSLINYRNRLKTMSNWIFAYFTKDQSLRMIIRPDGKREQSEFDGTGTKRV